MTRGPQVVESQTVRVALDGGAERGALALKLYQLYQALTREGWRVVALSVECERPCGHATLLPKKGP